MSNIHMVYPEFFQLIVININRNTGWSNFLPSTPESGIHDFAVFQLLDDQN